MNVEEAILSFDAVGLALTACAVVAFVPTLLVAAYVFLRRASLGRGEEDAALAAGSFWTELAGFLDDRLGLRAKKALSLVFFLFPAAPAILFTVLFEIEAADSLLLRREAAPRAAAGEDWLSGVLAWPAFVIVGLAAAAGVVGLCLRLRARYGGQRDWLWGLALLVYLAVFLLGLAAVLI